MSDIAIKFENISKQYRLGLVSTRTLSHDLNRWWQTTVLRREDPYLKIGETNDRSKKGDSEYVWALRDIDFEVKQGEVLGIIGKNGAGKSTLLKILSRVTTPTTGAIKAKGRIASLLEVGTGFHPELTGRENIYMNGCIMGMTKPEINRKLDEIIDFAGVERYIDTPVKRYSSGMTVRLGFSIAAHLEPEILVVDEVLAVGDAEFQKKAIGKMQDVSQGGGRTVLFVSHQMGMIQKLCTRGILLKDGSIHKSGNINSVIDEYQKSTDITTAYVSKERDSIISSVELVDKIDNAKTNFTNYDPIKIKTKINFDQIILPFTLGIAVKDSLNNKIFTVTKTITCITNGFVVCEIPDSILVPGNYLIDIASFRGKGEINEYINDACCFTLLDGGTELSEFEGIDYGKVFVKASWNV